MPTETEEWFKTTLRNIWRWTIRLAVLPGLGAIVAFFVWQHINAEAIRELTTQIVDAGDPLTPNDLARNYGGVPDEQNAAIPLMALWEPGDPDYWRAFRDRQTPPTKRSHKKAPPGVPVLGKSLTDGAAVELPWPTSNQVEAVNFLAEHGDEIAQLHRALERPACRFPLQWEQALSMHLPHLEELRRGAQLIALAALQHVQDGDLDSAIRQIRLIVRLGACLQDEHLSVSQLTKVAINTTALNCLSAVCNSSTITQSVLDSCLSIHGDLALPNGHLPEILKTERAVALAMIDYHSASLTQYLQSSEGEVSASDRRGLKLGLAIMRLTGIPKSDKRFLLETYRDAIALSTDPYPASVSSLGQFGESLNPKVSGFPPKLMSAILLPPFGKLAHRFATYTALHRALHLALEVERHKLTQGGKQGGGLSGLVADELLKTCSDPYTGQPMRFQTIEGGYVIWSVGRDLKDDNGTIKSAKDSKVTSPPDVGVRILRRPRHP